MFNRINFLLLLFCFFQLQVITISASSNKTQSDKSSYVDPLVNVESKNFSPESDTPSFIDVIHFLVKMESNNVKKFEQSRNSAFSAVVSSVPLQPVSSHLQSKREKKEAANKEYLERVEYYEKTVFQKTLTKEQRDLYCGHLLEKNVKK